MKRVLSSLLVFGLSLMLVACGSSGGSGSTTSTSGTSSSTGGGTQTAAPAPNNVGFSNASLKGTYIYRVTGSGNSGGPYPFADLGYFTADGNGNITAGREDTAGGLNAGPMTLAGTYTVGVDGRGSTALNYANGTGGFTFVMGSASRGRIIKYVRSGWTRTTTDAVGTFEKQDSVPTALSGNYVLSMDGIDNKGRYYSRVGVLTAGAGGSLTAVFDENLAGTFTGPISATGTSNLDPATGRGTIQLTTSSGGINGTGGTSYYFFYVVSPSRLHILEVDGSVDLSGYADAQSGTFTTANLAGTYAFHLFNQPGPFNAGNVRVGRFALDGSGSVSNGLEDAAENTTGYLSSINFSGSYAADTTAARNGRVTGSVTESTTIGLRTLNFVMWFSGAGSAVMMTTANTPGSAAPEIGVVQSQSATPTNATLNGNYALQLFGTSLTPANFNVGWTETGQLAANGQGVLTGLADISTNAVLTTGTSASGTYSVGSNGRGTGFIGGVPVVLYPVDASTAFVVTAEGSTVSGALEAQHP